MSRLKLLQKSPEFQRVEDVLGVLVLFVLLYAGLTLTGTA
jgi:hypothetical protein